MFKRLSNLAMLLVIAAGTTLSGTAAAGWPLPPPPPPPPSVPNVPPPPAVPPLPLLPPRPCTSKCDVQKSERALVLVNVISQGDKYKPLYQFMEVGGSATTYATLRAQYGQVRELKGSQATANGFVNAVVGLEKQPGIEAVDVIVILHGAKGSTTPSNGSLQFADRMWKVDFAENGQPSLDALFDQVRSNSCSGTPAAKATCASKLAAKDRVVLSTACYGQRHMNGWKKIGFAAVSGSIGVYADSMASYPAMLDAWGKGYTFGETISRGNTADPARSYDAWARLLGFDDVNSVRTISGPTTLTIWSKPR